MLLLYAVQQIVKFLVSNEQKFALEKVVKFPAVGEREREAVGVREFPKAVDAVRQQYKEKFTKRSIPVCHVRQNNVAYRWCEYVLMRDK
eukprot:gene950-267_t